MSRKGPILRILQHYERSELGLHVWMFAQKIKIKNPILAIFSKNTVDCLINARALIKILSSELTVKIRKCALIGIL